MSGSFWKFSNGFTSLSNISTLLEDYNRDQESGKIEEGGQFRILLKLLSENDLLQELLSNNPMLMGFLREDKVLSMLVDLVITEGIIDEFEEEANHDAEQNDKQEQETEKEDSTSEKSSLKFDNNEEEEEEDEDNEVGKSANDDDDEPAETEEEKATKRATIAAEILSADVWSLTDAVMVSTENLNRLWEILDNKEPLSINLSTYFMKIMEHLLDMKCDDMITYLIENQPNLVAKFINHLSNPPLMDFLLKLISTDKPDNSTGIIDFYRTKTWLHI